MSPVVGDSWGCREVAVYRHDALEDCVHFWVRGGAVEYDACNRRKNFYNPKIRAIVMECQGELVGEEWRLDFDGARNSFLQVL